MRGSHVRVAIVALSLAAACAPAPRIFIPNTAEAHECAAECVSRLGPCPAIEPQAAGVFAQTSGSGCALDHRQCLEACPGVVVRNVRIDKGDLARGYERSLADPRAAQGGVACFDAAQQNFDACYANGASLNGGEAAGVLLSGFGGPGSADRASRTVERRQSRDTGACQYNFEIALRRCEVVTAESAAQKAARSQAMTERAACRSYVRFYCARFDICTRAPTPDVGCPQRVMEATIGAGATGESCNREDERLRPLACDQFLRSVGLCADSQDCPVGGVCGSSHRCEAPTASPVTSP